MEQPGLGEQLQVPERRGWVLVCDDTESIRLLIRINLELAGFEVVEATDGGSTLALLRSAGDNLPVVVILDAQMEPVDGWSATAAIRGSEKLRHLPIIMVTAAIQQHQRARGNQADLDAFVGKPFDPDSLVRLVQGFAAAGRHFRNLERP